MVSPSKYLFLKLNGNEPEWKLNLSAEFEDIGLNLLKYIINSLGKELRHEYQHRCQKNDSECSHLAKVRVYSISHVVLLVSIFYGNGRRRSTIFFQ